MGLIEEMECVHRHHQQRFLWQAQLVEQLQNHLGPDKRQDTFRHTVAHATQKGWCMRLIEAAVAGGEAVEDHQGKEDRDLHALREERSSKAQRLNLCRAHHHHLPRASTDPSPRPRPHHRSPNHCRTVIIAITATVCLVVELDRGPRLKSFFCDLTTEGGR